MLISARRRGSVAGGGGAGGSCPEATWGGRAVGAGRRHTPVRPPEPAVAGGVHPAGSDGAVLSGLGADSPSSAEGEIKTGRKSL